MQSFIKISIAIFIFSTFTHNLKAQNVNIPDTNFKNALLTHIPIIDTNADGEIQQSEANSFVDFLSINSKSISDLTGIEAFVNATGLNCSYNNITNLDLSNNLNLSIIYSNNNSLTSINTGANNFLTILRCHENSLLSIDVSQNGALTELKADKNQLSSIQLNNPNLAKLFLRSNHTISSLDLSSETNLQFLDCGGNNLTSLDLSNNSELRELDFSSNTIFAIDLSSNTKLIEISFIGNQISSLNVSNNLQLRKINAYFNLISSIDLSNNSSLRELNIAYNSLTNLDLSNNLSLEILWSGGNNISSLDFTNNLNLSEIYSSEGILSSINVSNLLALKNLSIYDNHLTALNVDNNLSLELLSIGDNPISTIDLSNNISLKTFIFHNINNLQSLNLKNGNNLSINKFEGINTPNLFCVTVDDPIYSTSNWDYHDDNLIFSSNCNNIETDIIAFSIPEELSPAIINLSDNSVSIDVPSGIDLTNIEPTISVSPGSIIDPNSEIAQDFTNAFTYTVTAENSNFSQTWSIDLTGVNVNPSDISISNNNIDENNLIGDIIGIFSTTDINPNDTHNYSLTTGIGDDDNGLFSISDNKLLAKTIFDYEVENDFSLRIMSNDNKGGTIEKVINIIINDLLLVEQLITIAPIPDKPENTTPFNIIASSSSGLELLFSIDGPASILEQQVTLDGTTGTVIITVEQIGDIDYAPTSSQISFEVKESQFITFNQIDTKSTLDEDFELFASSTSGLAIAYTSSNESIIKISGNVVSILGSGSTFITASQIGNTTYASASNIEQTLIVSKADQIITFSALADKLTTDAAFALTATTDATGLTVSYTSSNENIATISGSTVTIIGAGTTTIAASQAGDATYNTATDATQTLTVNKVDQTITFDAISYKSTIDADFELTATSSSSLVVSYASSDATVATVSGNTVTIIGVGTTTITASQAGNATYNAASDATQTLTVNKVDQIITFDAISDKSTIDADFELTATSSSSLVVSYASSDATVATVSGNTVTIIGVGTTTITASQAGDATYNAATDATQTLTVNKVDQTITFDAISDKSTIDATFDLTATTDATGLTVSYVSSDETVATISGSTVTIIGGGSTAILASQAGNATYNAATSIEQTLIVNKADQIITFDAIADKITTDTAFDIIASTTSGLELTFVITGPATLVGTLVTLDGTEGSVAITASQVGDAIYNTATDVAQTLTINKVDQTITFNAIADQILEDGSLTLTATASSALDITYEVIEGPATVASSVVTFTGVGAVTIKASQEGNDSFNAATAVEQSFEIETITGLEVSSENEISIYPNPTGDYVNVNGAYDYIRIIDTNGSVVYQSTENKKQIDISSLQSGNYIVLITNNYTDKTLKLLIE